MFSFVESPATRRLLFELYAPDVPILMISGLPDARQAETSVEEKNEWHYALACPSVERKLERAASPHDDDGKLKHTRLAH
jgi:hypothetical protein